MRRMIQRRATLVHPLAIAAVIVLIVNDHVLKAAFPGFVTGKLSDVAGLVFFPLLLAEVAALALRRDAARLVPTAATLTLLAFAFVKLTPEGAAAFSWGIGAAQWFVALLATGQAALRPTTVTMDPTDLIALPAVLVAVAIAQTRRTVAGPIRVVPHRTRDRLSKATAAFVMAAATMATTSRVAPTGVVASEQLNVGHDEVAVRHVVWSVVKPTTDFTFVRLEVSTRTGDADADAEPAAISTGGGPDDDAVSTIRIVPDDPRQATFVTRDGSDYEFTTVRLDVTEACRLGCSGGARVFASALSGRVVIRLTTGREAEDTLLTLTADGVGDYTGPIGIVDSGAQEAQIELDHGRLSWTGAYTLHLSAAALAAPYADLRPILRTGVMGVDDKAGMGVAATLTIGTSSMPLDAGGAALWHVIDLADQCTVGLACDIPIRLDVAALPGSSVYVPGASPGPSPTAGQGVDVYRWSVRVEVEALDGRSLPADGASIEPAPS
jgi:hypothetical protein